MSKKKLLIVSALILACGVVTIVPSLLKQPSTHTQSNATAPAKTQPLPTKKTSATTVPITQPATTTPQPLPGLVVVYGLNNSLWIWSESAPAREILQGYEGHNAKFSDDGQVIVFDGDNSLWAVNSDGSNPRKLVVIESYATPILPALVPGLTPLLAQFDLQPGTHWVYFSTTWGKDKIYLPSYDLHRVDADSPTPQVLLTEGGGTFTFSPDGSLLALSSRTNIKIIHANGNSLVTALSYRANSTKMDYGPQIVWISNVTGFYTVLPDPIIQKSKYFFVPGDGRFSAQLAEFDTIVPAEISAPIVSPDGLKVAYVVKTSSSFELHVIDTSTADVTIASHPGASFLELWEWSPDSKQIVYWMSHPVFPLTAGIGIPSSPITKSTMPYSLRWITADRFIFFREGELLIGQIGNPNVISIASGFAQHEQLSTNYDFILTSSP